MIAWAGLMSPTNNELPKAALLTVLAKSFECINTKGKYSLTINYSNIDKSNERINIHKAVIQQLLNLNNVSSLATSSEQRLPDTVNVNQIYDEAGQYIAQARNSLVSNNYFAELDLKLTGKGFNKGDEKLKNPPIVVNQRLADMLDKNTQNVLNSKVSFDSKTFYSIVGVVSNTYVPGRPESENFEVFTPNDYPGWSQYTYLLTMKDSASISQIQQLTAINARKLIFPAWSSTKARATILQAAFEPQLTEMYQAPGL